MAKDPAFLFYYQDFLVGTTFMTNEEVGAYIRILCHLADKGGLSEEHMKNICQSYDIYKSIKSKFKLNGDNTYYNDRLRSEIEKRQKYAESRRNNRSGKNICKSYDKHMENENENINENLNLNLNLNNINEFEHFWNLYDKKVGKANALKQWKKLKPDEVERIFIHLKDYLKKEKQYRKDPERYLKHKTFNDEVVNTSITKNSGASPDELAEIVARRFQRENGT